MIGASAGQEIGRLLDRELEGFTREVELFADDESLWRTVPGVENSVGNLAMHLAGGLQHFIGSALGGTGYTRNRDLEFSRRTGTRHEVIAELNRARAVIRDVVPRLTDEALSAPFTGPFPGESVGTRLFLMHLAAHAAMHLGQAGYLRRMLNGDSQSSGPLPIEPLMRP